MRSAICDFIEIAQASSAASEEGERRGRAMQAAVGHRTLFAWGTQRLSTAISHGGESMAARRLGVNAWIVAGGIERNRVASGVSGDAHGRVAGGYKAVTTARRGGVLFWLGEELGRRLRTSGNPVLDGGRCSRGWKQSQYEGEPPRGALVRQRVSSTSPPPPPPGGC
jgi:hypothetical protein